MSVRYALLGLLAEEPDYGYRLKQRFDDSIGSFWELNNGQVYDSLRRLESSDLITRIDSSRDQEAENAYGPRMRYKVTAKGQKALSSWLRRRSAVPRPIRDEMFVRLAFLVNTEPRLLLRRLDDQEGVYRRRLHRLVSERNRIRKTEGSSSTALILGFDAVMFHLEAHLRWIEHCRVELVASQPDSVKGNTKAQSDGISRSPKKPRDSS